MTNIFNLSAKPHHSRVLADYLKSRPGAAHRVEVKNVAVSSNHDSMVELFAPISSSSGFAVTDKTAMSVTAVYACLSKIAGVVLQLPVKHYKNSNGERERIHNSPLWWLLNEQPHALWTSASWKEWIVRCVYLRGDQHTQILRSSNASGGQVIGLLPHHPDRVQARLISVPVGGARLVYDVSDRLTGQVTTVDQDDMLHFTGFGFDGVRSLSAIQHVAKQAVGNSLAGADYTGRTMGDGGMPRVVLEYPNKMTPEQAQKVRDSFVSVYTGSNALRTPLVLNEGAKVRELSLSPVDMQLIQSRGFEKQEICEALGVPPIIIGNSEKTSSWGSGIEQITRGFVTYTIQPILCRWQEELNRKLFRNAGQFVEFEPDGLLRGDSKAQSDFFKSALGGPGSGDGYMSVNEIRKLKNLPSVEGGDELFKAQRGTVAAAPADPAVPADPADPNPPQDPTGD